MTGIILQSVITRLSNALPLLKRNPAEAFSTIKKAQSVLNSALKEMEAELKGVKKAPVPDLGPGAEVASPPGEASVKPLDVDATGEGNGTIETPEPQNGDAIAPVNGEEAIEEAEEK